MAEDGRACQQWKEIAMAAGNSLTPTDALIEGIHGNGIQICNHFANHLCWEVTYQ
jgi:hypothetical protein